MQKIDNIEIKNFKSIRHQKIEGCKRINVFIGYPNVGKSNILEALSLFSIDKPDVDFSSFVRMGELPTLFFDGNVNEKVEVSLNKTDRVTAILSESNKEIRFIWHLSKDDTYFDRWGDLDVAAQRLYYTKSSEEKKIVNWESNIKIQSQSVDFIKKFGDNFLAKVKKYNFQKNLQYISGKYDFLSVPNGENILDIIYTHEDIRKQVASLFEIYGLELIFDYGKQTLSILKRIQNGVFSIPYDLVADTLQRLIFYKAAILSNKESILLFEEPESHMFPPYISKFTNDIIFDKKNNQYFIATHSPYVLNDFMDNLKSDELAIYIVSYNNETGETEIHRMNENDMHEAYQFGYDFFMNIDKFIPQEQHDEV